MKSEPEAGLAVTSRSRSRGAPRYPVSRATARATGPLVISAAMFATSRSLGAASAPTKILSVTEFETYSGVAAVYFFGRRSLYT
jgi:hypothetical protein